MIDMASKNLKYVRPCQENVRRKRRISEKEKEGKFKVWGKVTGHGACSTPEMEEGSQSPS